MTTIIKIGNSLGIRIPKRLIEEAKLENRQIDLILTKNGLLLQPVKTKLRRGWDKPQKAKENIESDFLNIDLENTWEW